MNDITYVGLDVHKATVCVAIAEGRPVAAASVYRRTRRRKLAKTCQKGCRAAVTFPSYPELAAPAAGDPSRDGR